MITNSIKEVSFYFLRTHPVANGMVYNNDMDMKDCVTASHIAKYIISKFHEKDTEIDEGISESVSNLKLQKLLCFCQAFSLARSNQPMFKEKIYAWKYGPVVKEVYEEYKKYENKPIPWEESSQKDWSDISDDHKKIIDEVLDIFGGYSAIRLMNITHSHKPWKDLEKKVVAGERNIEITHEAMEKYYQPLLSN